MQIILFEDDAVDRLAPLAVAEPAFAITCGSYKLVQLASGLGPEISLVREHLRPVEMETYPRRAPPSRATARNTSAPAHGRKVTALR